VIVYSLKCENSHEFDDWFSSIAAFDRQAAAGEVVCPECGSTRIEKAPMAPAVAGSKSGSVSACPMADCASEAPPCAGGCGCFPG
jgi:hypothetical protein